MNPLPLTRQDIPPSIYIKVLFKRKKDLEQGDGWRDLNQKIGSHKAINKVPRIWHNQTQGYIKKAKKVNEKRMERKPKASSKALLVEVELTLKRIVDLSF